MRRIKFNEGGRYRDKGGLERGFKRWLEIKEKLFYKWKLK